MTNDERNPNSEGRNPKEIRSSNKPWSNGPVLDFGFRASFGIRHSEFGLYFVSLILRFRNQIPLPCSCSRICPLTRSPNPGTFLNLLSATAALTVSLPQEYSSTLTPFSQCST